MNQGGCQTLKMSLATHREVTWMCLYTSSTKHILLCVRMYYECIHTHIYTHTPQQKTR